MKFATALGAETLAALRGMTADEVLQLALKTQPGFTPNLDGYFMPESAAAIFAAGKQASVPLLAGWNADEVRGGTVLGKEKPTAQSFVDSTRKRFGDEADAILKAYPAATDAEALESAASLASDSSSATPPGSGSKYIRRPAMLPCIATRSTGRFPCRPATP